MKEYAFTSLQPLRGAFFQIQTAQRTRAPNVLWILTLWVLFVPLSPAMASDQPTAKLEGRLWVRRESRSLVPRSRFTNLL
jgi:hypothetical protein